MEVTSSTASVAATAAKTNMADTPFSKIKDQFTELAAKVIDTSGKFSDSERADAYSVLHGFIATGKTIGIDESSLNSCLSKL